VVFGGEDTRGRQSRGELCSPDSSSPPHDSTKKYFNVLSLILSTCQSKIALRRTQDCHNHSLGLARADSGPHAAHATHCPRGRAPFQNLCASRRHRAARTSILLKACWDGDARRAWVRPATPVFQMAHTTSSMEQAVQQSGSRVQRPYSYYELDRLESCMRPPGVLGPVTPVQRLGGRPPNH
jgi:hypothetical protein